MLDQDLPLFVHREAHRQCRPALGAAADGQLTYHILLVMMVRMVMTVMMMMLTIVLNKLGGGDDAQVWGRSRHAPLVGQGAPLH